MTGVHHGAVRARNIVPSALMAAALSCVGSSVEAQQGTVTIPNVTVTASAVPVSLLYLRAPGSAYARNPYSGYYRVEEDKFPEVPCTATRLASAAGGKCLQGYRLIPGATDQITNPKGASNCDIALDVVAYTVGNLAVEADTTITDPYKVTAIGFHSAYCYVNGYPGYNQDDFHDMNRVTWRDTNWHNLIGQGEDKTIDFSDGTHRCVAIKKRVRYGKAATSI
jgi:hypothetical protein